MRVPVALNISDPEQPHGAVERDAADDLNADFPPGPLDLYRKNSSFDWTAMRATIEGEKILKFKVFP